MKRYRVALVGCGPRGVQQSLAYAAHPRTEVVALCDLRRPLLDQLGERLGVTTRYEEMERMLREIEPDVVALPTGTEYHHALCLQALSGRCHVDVEKPLATDLLQADEIIALAHHLGRRVAVHHQGRVGGAMRALTAAIAAGKLGEVNHLRATDKGYYGGYGLMNIGCHLISYLLHLGGRCRAVTATALSAGEPITPADVLAAPYGMGVVAGERISAILELADGLLGELRLHRFPKVVSGVLSVEVYGTEGRALWSPAGVWWLPAPHFQPGGHHDTWELLPAAVHPALEPGGEVNEDELWFVEELVQSLDSDRPHISSGEAALHGLEVMMGIFEAAAWQQRVALPQADRRHPLLRWRQEHGLPPPTPGPRDYNAWLAAEDQRLLARRRASTPPTGSTG